jgi:acetamidase/formamidase
MKIRQIAIGGVLFLAAASAAAQSVATASRLPGHVHLLPATLETTQWGWFDNAQAPVLTIGSGDTVVLETMMHSHNQVVPGRTIEEIKKLRTDNPGRGPHTLTGPIYVTGAEPGDTLKIKINRIVPRAYATNFNVPGMFGEFPKEYQDGQVKYLYLDMDRMVTEFLPGVYRTAQTVPRHDRGGAQGTGTLQFRAARRVRRQHGHPRPVRGAILYVPVHVPGALLWTGDSHAARATAR